MFVAVYFQIHSFENACATKRRAIKTLKGNVKNLSIQTHHVKGEVEKWHDLAHTVQVKNSEVNRTNLTDEERLAELNKVLDEREAIIRLAEQKVVKLRNSNYQKTQQNVDLRAELDAATVTVRGNSLYLNNLYGTCRCAHTSQELFLCLIYHMCWLLL